MPIARTRQSIEKINELVATTNNPSVREALDLLGKAISIGDISNSTGVAIGRNIRMVVNQLNLAGETVASLLGVRNELGAALGLDPQRYRVDALLTDKTRNFVGRNYVFDGINEFITNQRSGYFIIEGDPGMGKSSIVAEYVRRTGCISHFNIRAIGITSARQFLEDICTQIIIDFGLPYSHLPPDATQDGGFLLRLVQEASAQLEPGERLIVAVDALDEVDLSGHPMGANILYLPSLLPDGVYFILTRRDVDVPMLTQSPQQELNLMAFPAENRNDVEFYIRRNSEHPELREWIVRQGMTNEMFVSKLAELSENNFMYLRYVLPELESGAYQNLDFEQLPVGLQGYYEDHWKHMGMTTKPLPRVKIRIIYVMCEVRHPVSRQLLSEFASDEAIKVDELTLQEVLDEWSQFLNKHITREETRYSLYHSSFRDFLHRKDVVQAAGVTIQGINALIANDLWDGLFGNKE
jgi:hypothetical protein